MALAFARDSMFKSQNRARDYTLKILLFFTDGKSFISNDGSALHQLGVIVYVIGVGPSVNADQLNKIATNQSYVFTVYSNSALVGQIYSDIKSKTCSGKFGIFKFLASV